MPSRCFMPSENVPARRPRDRVEPDQLEHLVDAAVRRCRWSRRATDRCAQAVRPAWTALASSSAPTSRNGLDDALVRATVDQAPARGRAVQAEDHPHRGGLARAVRAEEPGHLPGPDREAEVVDRGDGAVALSQSLHLDHDRADPAPGRPGLASGGRAGRPDGILRRLGQGRPGRAGRPPGPTEDQVGQAAPGDRDADDDRPPPLGQVARLARAGQIDQADDREQHEQQQDRDRGGEAGQAGRHNSHNREH